MAKQRQSTATQEGATTDAPVTIETTPPKAKALAAVRPAPAPIRYSADEQFRLGLLDAARDPQFDVAKLERLIDLQVQEKRRQAEAAFARDFALMQGELPIVSAAGLIEVQEKDETGRRTGQIRRTPFVRLSDIRRAVGPIMAKYGFALRFVNQLNGNILTVTGVLSHRDGHSERDTFDTQRDDSGKKNLIQSWGSARSYARRYLTLALLNIASEVDEPDTDGYEPEDAPRPVQRYAQERRPSPRDGEAISEPQARRLKAILTNAGHMEDTVRKWLSTAYGCTLETIPKGEYDAICRIVERGEVLR